MSKQEVKEIKLAGQAVNTATRLISEVQQAQQRLAAYLQGILDNQKLIGTWNLNTQTMVLQRQETPVNGAKPPQKLPPAKEK